MSQIFSNGATVWLTTVIVRVGAGTSVGSPRGVPLPGGSLIPEWRAALATGDMPSCYAAPPTNSQQGGLPLKPRCSREVSMGAWLCAVRERCATAHTPSPGLRRRHAPTCWMRHATAGQQQPPRCACRGWKRQVLKARLHSMIAFVSSVYCKGQAGMANFACKGIPSRGVGGATRPAIV